MSEDTKEWLAGEVLRLGAEVRDLSISNAVLRQDNDELHKDYESLANEHTKLIDRNKTLKAEVDALKLGSLLTAVDVLQFINLKTEVERLRASSFVTAVPVEEYEKLKAEVERLTKAEVERLRKEGEAMYPNLGPGWSHNAKEGKQP